MMLIRVSHYCIKWHPILLGEVNSFEEQFPALHIHQGRIRREEVITILITVPIIKVMVKLIVHLICELEEQKTCKIPCSVYASRRFHSIQLFSP